MGGPYFIPAPNLLFMEFVVPSLDSSFSTNSEELLDEINVKHQIAVQATIACVNTWEFFTPTKLEGGGQSMDINNKCVRCFNNHASHAKFVQILDQFQFD
jgi:hypothetical protein